MAYPAATGKFRQPDVGDDLGVDLGTVADELYGLPPSEFTSTRNDRAAAAKKAGDRELADAIRQLSRPTTSAWLSNLLVRHRRDQVDQLLDLGGALREAQQQLAGDELRRLSQQRHEVVATLAAEARSLARDAGERVSETVVRELEDTLEAALADVEAAVAVSSGRLQKGLQYSGLGGVDLSDAVAAPAAVPARPDRKVSAAPVPRDDERDTRRREAALAEVRAAEAAAAEADESAEDAEQRLTEAREKHDAVREQLAAAAKRVEELREREIAAARAVRAAGHERDAAEKAGRAAEQRVARARTKLESADSKRGKAS